MRIKRKGTHLFPRTALIRSVVLAASFALATACTNEDERGNQPLPEGGDGQRREVLLTLKNQFAPIGTKAGTRVGTATKAGTPIATTAENTLATLDVYVFAADTEQGTYTYQERFAYRADGSALPTGATALDLSVAATDTEAKALISMRKGLYVRLYAIANQTALADPANGGALVADNAFDPLTMTQEGKTMKVMRPGKPAEAEFLAFHTPLLTAEQAADVILTPLPMAGAYTTALDLTDFETSARTQVGFKMTRLVSRFDIVNEATTSKFTLQSISMAKGRRGSSFFPIRVYGTQPDAQDTELITYPARTFEGDNANKGTQPGAFYSYPSPTDDAGYLILNGTYAVNQTESQEVSYRIPFKQANAGDGSFLEINHNHRYTIAITDADAYHLDFTMTVDDWADDGHIDDYNPGGEDGKDEPIIDLTADPSGKTAYDPDARTIFMPITAGLNATFSITAGTAYVPTKTYAGSANANDHDWLEISAPEAVTRAADGYKYTFSLKSGYVGGEYPEAALRFTHPNGGRSFAFRVKPIDTIVKLTGYDVKETDDDSYRVITAGGTLSLTVSCIGEMPGLAITTDYDNDFGAGNNWLPAPANPTKTEVVGNRRIYTYEIAIPATTGTDADYQLHKGTVTVKDGTTDQAFTIWRGASNKPYPAGDAASSPYYTALKKGAYWWAPVNCGAKHVAQNQADTDGVGNFYQWGRKDGAKLGPTMEDDVQSSTLSDYTQAQADKFYTPITDTYDWLYRQNNNLWQNGLNDPCPTGYRVPTINELKAWGTSNVGTWDGQLLSIGCDDGFPQMVLSGAGFRGYNNGNISLSGYGFYWSSTTNGTKATYASFDYTSINVETNYRANGLSVRCLRK